MQELRKDPIIGRWVIVFDATHRWIPDFGQVKLPKSSKPCPFCNGNESMTPPEILAFREPGTKTNGEGWWVRVVPNKFPALKIEGGLERRGVGIYDMMNGIGAHEVLIDSPDHWLTPAELEENHVEKIIWAYRDRIRDLRNDVRLKYVLIFKNHGSIAGASLEHPHSQLIATPIVPKRVKEELAGTREYFKYKERCLYCDIIRQELKERKRIIVENEGFISFTPYASRFPYEICIIPKKHQADFSTIDNYGTSQLANILKLTLISLKNTLGDPAYNYMLHTVPLTLSSDLEDYHWHFEVIPRLVRVAGFEWGTGFYINPVPPEVAAEELRKSIEIK